MSFYPLLNTKEDILKNIVTKQLTVAIDFHSMIRNTMEDNGYRQLFGHTALGQLEGE